VSLVLWSGFLLVEPTQFPEVHLAEDLNPLLQHDDQIGIEGVIVKYSFYPYLTRHDVWVYGCYASGGDSCPGQDPDYILSLQYYREHPGYKLLATHTIHYPINALDGPDWTGYLFVRDHPKALGPRPPGCNPGVA